MNVVVVESPAKAKTINKYLGSDFKVLASYGHVRDLPSKDGSVEPDDDFAMSWEVDAKAAKRLSDIADALKGADRLILATDPDREGEAITWHVLEVLQKKKAIKDKVVQRVAFNAITKSARRWRPWPIRARSTWSWSRPTWPAAPWTIWSASPSRRSCGASCRAAARPAACSRSALRLVVDRELEIERFKTQEYWTVEADVSAGAEPFLARLVKHEGKKLTKFDLGNETSALAARAAVQAATFKVAAVEKKPGKRSPAPPFTTSTLQQEAARKLGFSAQRTMQAAQKLYEGIDIGGETVGLITYMRTDGVSGRPRGASPRRAA